MTIKNKFHIAKNLNIFNLRQKKQNIFITQLVRQMNDF